MNRAMFTTISLPDTVVGLTELDKTKFIVKATVPSITLENPSTFNEQIFKLKSLFLKLPQFKPVQETSEGKKTIILDPAKQHDDILKNYTLVPIQIELGYDNFSSDAILQKVLSKVEAGGTGFSLIGHILHLNLRDHLAPYKKLIGQVLLEKNKNVKIVVNKTTQIDSTYRNFSFEVLAGVADTVVRVKEHGCLFEFDFAKVYWNPRLATEHSKIANLMSNKTVLFDVFGGVGPFAVPAAKRGCDVYANDLNPDSYKGLLKNLKLNKVEAKVTAFNLDGREFLKTILPEKIREHSHQNVHVTMNLPAMAVEFLDVFQQLDIPTDIELTVHCYLFVKCEQKKRVETVWKLVNQFLGDEAERFTIVSKQEHFVRNVAPSKDMMRATIVLKYLKQSENEEPVSKKSKHDSND